MQTLGSRSVLHGELSATGSKLATDELTGGAGAERILPRCVYGLFSGQFSTSAGPPQHSNPRPLHSGSECNPMGCGRTPVATPSNSRYCAETLQNELTGRDRVRVAAWRPL